MRECVFVAMKKREKEGKMVLLKKVLLCIVTVNICVKIHEIMGGT